MNIQINTLGGGMFALYHECLEEILILCETKQIEIVNLKNFRCVIHDSCEFKNKTLFDDIFVYEDDLTNFTVYNMTTVYNTFLNANKNKELLVLLKQIVHKNKIHPTIINKVNYYKELLNINDNTLGVHVRITDMNHIHGDIYNSFTIESYFIKIDQMLNQYTHINNIFIASDNIVSINKIKNYYKDNKNIRLSYIEDSIRNPEEHCQTSNFMINEMNKMNNYYHVNVMIEMLVLSKCSYLIHRISDFANFAIIYSDTFKEIQCL